MSSCITTTDAKSNSEQMFSPNSYLLVTRAISRGRQQYYLAPRSFQKRQQQLSLYFFCHELEFRLMFVERYGIKGAIEIH